MLMTCYSYGSDLVKKKAATNTARVSNMWIEFISLVYNAYIDFSEKYNGGWW
jgi:hypothetical protein